MAAFKTIKEIVRMYTYILMKISGIVYMHINTHFFDKNPSGFHNNLSPRLELLAGMNDDLPVKVSQYS
jgi:hypothetical protein